MFKIYFSFSNFFRSLNSGFWWYEKSEILIFVFSLNCGTHCKIGTRMIGLSPEVYSWSYSHTNGHLKKRSNAGHATTSRACASLKNFGPKIYLDATYSHASGHLFHKGQAPRKCIANRKVRLFNFWNFLRNESLFLKT